MVRSLWVAALATLAVFPVACGSAAPADDQDGASGEVVVFAAASLTETFTELGRRFEEANPGTTVTFNFAGSSSLAKQIVEGAPVDVFASASPANMEQVTETDAVSGEPTVFVRNRLEIAVPAGNPGDVTGIADFADEDRTIALCAEEVPCGAAARKALDAAGVTAAPDTLERDVKAVLTKVELGEVDAALVYRTDVRAADDTVEGIAFPESERAVNDYPIATMAEAPNTEGARAFVDFVLSDAGRSVLTDAGFDGP
ncbi:molybdate ABC transporter substrate-binding protein [Actinophytocola gossypii]|uniref:Molybdate ABC transporter substrate-binding protein n=1 Tax=Actinophytocola gossypii TaxID=2812003 RepID=A0ABT2JIE9_9PSEU|nr:molybdate ABC transporter substrate-binding protein [Actinophytocola gossypii]MCT2587653.1 molybdate ABC transporter substrate-binding protein [Actinophytocola gossypii]